MNNFDSTSSQGFAPLAWLKSKRISYLTLPLIVMATIVEFVILATGWKYQQVVCLPHGMGVTFFGIGPIGATILAVELLKLPLAIWTASRRGWQKGVMLMVGLPLICILTFQLVKDMAVYEMGVAMTPASQYLEQATGEEAKADQLKHELAGIEQTKAECDRKRVELAARQAKAKTDLEESLKQDSETRQDAVSLTDYQKKELSEVESRQATIIKQFDADAEQLTKGIAELREQREVEVGRATKWNAEEARIENEYKSKMSDYANDKASYEKAKLEYDSANFLKRQLMREPVDPGVPPVRETNTILKPVEIAVIDAQIKAKDNELLDVNNKRRDRVAQVDADARKLRENFDKRSTSRRAEADKKREDLLAAQTAQTAQFAADERAISQEYSAAAQKVDGIRAKLDETKAKAESFYEQREAAIKTTQVHRIATTVEIVRALWKGQRPVSIQATAKERGDLYTDQISMVRIYVYPVLAFIVAFLPTLMVELGFSTVFHKDEETQPAHRLGFFGKHLHTLYIRAGRQKMLRAERLAQEAAGKIAVRDNALTAARAESEKALAEKETELKAAREATAAVTARHGGESKKKEEEWVAKYTELADSLNRAVVEKDGLRDLQKSEIERQIQMRQNAWSDRLTQLRQELDEQRTAAETERTTLVQEQHRKLMEVTEECKTQVIQARRQLADAELASVEKSAKLAHDLKEALQARDAAETRLKQQADSLTAQLAQAKDETAREVEKATRQEKHRLEHKQLEFEKTLRQREEDAERRSRQHEQELSAAFETRLMEERVRLEQVARRRETELESQTEARVREVDSRWALENQQREEATQLRWKQREQQLNGQAEVRLSEAKAQAEQEVRRREAELQRKVEAQARENEMKLRQEMQQKELTFHAKMKQREQEWITQAAERDAECQAQFAADLRTRNEEWERQAEARVRTAESRMEQEAQQREELALIKLRQREQQLQSQFDARQAEWKAQSEQDLRIHEQEWERNAEARSRATEARWIAEVRQTEELSQSKLRQRDEQWPAKLASARAEWQSQADQEARRREVEFTDAKARALREQETQLRKEMQAKQENAERDAQKREHDWMSELSAKTEAQGTAEREREQAVQNATDSQRQVQELKAKLAEVSSLLSGWKSSNGPGNGSSVKQPAGYPVGRNG